MFPPEKQAMKAHGLLHSGRGEKRKGKMHGTFRELNMDGFHYQTQNPHKNTPTGKLAKAGHEVTWIKQNGRYIGTIVDGKITRL